MSEIKKGAKVRVSYEALYEDRYERSGTHNLVTRPGYWYWSAPSSATIEVIEEPYEEGAIYESGCGHRWAYLPNGTSEPWVFVSFPRQSCFSFGDRVARDVPNGPLRKLAPVE